ncbi:MAG: hypothetical protein K6G08_03790 [Prevotella sp.]|nr:hypothetical protein [Prevotella sp.]
MKKKRIIALCVLLLATCVFAEAQTRRNNSRNRVRTTGAQKKAEPEKKDTMVLASKKEEPKYKSLSDTMVVKYLRGGFAKENKLHLMTNSDYASLPENQKQEVLTKVAQEFTGYDMTLNTGGQGRELWITDGNNVKCLEKWNNDSLRIEDYLPLELKRSGETKVFYYVGGMLNGGNGSTSYSLNLRGGTYLYENLLDASVTLNLGGNKPEEGESRFTGDVGVDSRAYLPFRIKNVNLAPYAGAGVSWSFAPESFFELRLLAGGCWFVGPGSLDIGLQYGTKSDFAVTLGYTFRIPSKKK